MGNAQGNEVKTSKSGKSPGKVKGLMKIRGKKGKNQIQFTEKVPKDPDISKVIDVDEVDDTKINKKCQSQMTEMLEKCDYNKPTDSWYSVDERQDNGEENNEEFITPCGTEISLETPLNLFTEYENTKSSSSTLTSSRNNINVSTTTKLSQEFSQNFTLNSFKLNEFSARREIEERRRKLNKLGISKTSQISLDGDKQDNFFNDAAKDSASDTQDTKGDCRVVSYMVKRLSETNLFADGHPEYRRYTSVPEESLFADNSISKRYAPFLISKSDWDDIIKRPKFVPEKLNFQLYEKFEGHMLINWYVSEICDENLKRTLSESEIKLLAAQFCTNLLAVGVLKQIQDKDVPMYNVFKPDCMYYWTYGEMSSCSVPQTPGRISVISWPPVTPDDSLKTMTNDAIMSSEPRTPNEHLEKYESPETTPVKKAEFRVSARDVELLSLEEEIQRLHQELEKYKTLVEIQNLTAKAVKDFESPVEDTKAMNWVCDKLCTVKGRHVDNKQNEEVLSRNKEYKHVSVQTETPTDVDEILVNSKLNNTNTIYTSSDNNRKTVTNSNITLPTSTTNVCKTLTNGAIIPPPPPLLPSADIVEPQITNAQIPPPPPMPEILSSPLKETEPQPYVTGGPPPPPLPIHLENICSTNPSSITPTSPLTDIPKMSSQLLYGMPPLPPPMPVASGPLLPPISVSSRPPPMPGASGPPPPPMPGASGPPPPPMPGASGPTPPPMPGASGPPPPPMPGASGPPPPPMPGTGGPPPPPMLNAIGPSPPPMPGIIGPPPPPSILDVGGPPPPPPLSNFTRKADVPLPLPVPPVGGFSLQKAALKKKPVNPSAPMKPLYWTRIITPPTATDSDCTSNALWNEIEELATDDLNEFSDLFSRAVITKKPSTKKIPQKTKVEAVKLLDSKRSQNVGILAQSLHVEFHEIENAIYNFDTSEISLEAIQQMYEVRATPDELELIKNHITTKPDVPLDKPENFLYELSEISNFAERIFCLMLMIEFEDSISSVNHALTNLKTTCTFLMTNKELKKVMAIILTLGNYMNGGNVTRGQADGFGLEILSKLRDVKSKDSKITLLHYVVKMYLKSLNGIVEINNAVLPIPEPEEIRGAGSFNFEDAAAALEKLKKQLDGCEHKTKIVIQSSSQENLQPFKDKMTNFLETSRAQLANEEENLKECKLKFIETMKFYLFKPKNGTVESVLPSTFFELWQNFCVDFKDIFKKEIIKVETDRLNELKKKEKERQVENKKIKDRKNGLKSKVMRYQEKQN